ncbi:MAG: hypothetical protein ACR5LG_04555 [Sodalis sp. (in: enterobacteria)]|uniref:hypothetical protein n=1 Tax=Sodalis sp. (in: enterobacteria) TaxID=1898979 RepID=UPI003F2B4F98
MNSLVAATRAPGGIGAVGVFVPQDPVDLPSWRTPEKCRSILAISGLKASRYAPGRQTSRPITGHWRCLIHQGKAHPAAIISYRLKVSEAPAAYQHFGDRNPGWTKVILKP